MQEYNDIRYQEAAARLEKIEAGFDDATESLTQIFSNLKLTRSIEIPEGAPNTEKYAASAAITSEMADLMKEAANPDSVQVAILLGKIGDKVRLALPGGAMQSIEEINWCMDRANADTAPPGNLFYSLAQEQLLSTGRLDFSYEVCRASENFQANLRTTLKREIGEELSSEALARIQLSSFLTGDRRTTLSTVKLPDEVISGLIARKLDSFGVQMDNKGVLSGVYTVVTERVAVAHGPLKDISHLAKENEEAKGIRVKTLGEMLELSKKTAESEDTYTNFKKHHTDRHGSDGVRNPSTTWGLKLLAGWIKGLVIASDPYREGARASHETYGGS